MGLFSRKNNEAPVEHLEAAAAEMNRPVAAKRTGTMIVYWAKDGWRWRLVAPNGKIVADSGEAYKRRYDCKVAAQHLTYMSRFAKLEVRDRA